MRRSARKASPKRAIPSARMLAEVGIECGAIAQMVAHAPAAFIRRHGIQHMQLGAFEARQREHRSDVLAQPCKVRIRDRRARMEGDFIDHSHTSFTSRLSAAPKLSMTM
jgi:uncharacterized protein YdiU (UPF0061 family)